MSAEDTTKKDQPDSEPTVEVTQEDHRFVLTRDGAQDGEALFVIIPGAASETGGVAGQSAADRVIFFHTEVDDELEGQGLAGRLVREALDATMASGATIVAVCPYVRAWLQRHGEAYAAHTAPARPADLQAVRDATQA
ncbi:MAG: GNAT family N-acetyltransferase [Terracoccus sp.]